MATMTTLRAPCRRLIGRMAAGRERGSSSIQMVILMPALFSIMFLGMQGALYYHARTVAIAAAQEGARAAGSLNGTAAGGIAAASSFVSDAGGRNVLRDHTCARPPPRTPPDRAPPEPQAESPPCVVPRRVTERIRTGGK